MDTSPLPTDMSSMIRNRQYTHCKPKARVINMLLKAAVAAGAGCIWSTLCTGVAGETCPHYKDFLGRGHKEMDCTIDENGPYCCGLRSLLYCCKDYNYSISNDRHVANIVDRSFNKEDVQMILLYMGIGVIFAMAVFFYNHWCGNRSSTRP